MTWSAALLLLALVAPPASAQWGNVFGPSRSTPVCPARLTLWAQRRLDLYRAAREAEAHGNATRAYRNLISGVMDWLEVMAARQKVEAQRRELTEALLRQYRCRADLR